jgi:hypothetical protein
MPAHFRGGTEENSELVSCHEFGTDVEGPDDGSHGIIVAAIQEDASLALDHRLRVTGPSVPRTTRSPPRQVGVWTYWLRR